LQAFRRFPFDEAGDPDKRFFFAGVFDLAKFSISPR